MSAIQIKPLNAFSLIESLVTLLVVVIALYFISPVIFKLHSQMSLDNEIEQIKNFVYHIQTKARYQQKNFSLSINQSRDRWCMVAVENEDEKQIACDCLNLTSCVIPKSYLLYQSPTRLKLISNSLYPNVFSNIYGVSGQLSNKCLGLEMDNLNEYIQFDPRGVIYVAQKGKRTTCR
ncbi:hypothetical protein A1D22_08425 [Pasteurellaceae bacterium LFhippo2]|nr:hypothetical protein [Pasteurellaceae bacterium LFhippo2]